MDKINRLHDDLLVKVLSFLPTKVAVSTSILSKRWEFLWMWLPNLEYDCTDYTKIEGERLRRFINLNLPLHKAPVRELSIKLFSYGYGLTKLPSSLYTSKSLVILKLEDAILVDVPRMVCLPFLKTLILGRVTYSNEKSLHQLLLNCPVLEELVVDVDKSYNSKTLSIIVPSLERLTLVIFSGNNLDLLLINTPSLKYLQYKDYKYDNRYKSDSDDDSDSDSDDDSDSDSYSLDYKDMPKLEEADIDLTYRDIDKFVRSIKFVKRLTLCIRVNAKEALYRDGIVFSQLEHLKLCSCDSNWSKVLVRLLKDSPILRELDVYVKDDHTDSCEEYSTVCWQNHDLDCVPQCLLWSLETFKWEATYGSEEEIDLVKYILANACFLKTATFLFRSPRSPEEEFKFELMKQELSLCFRGSATCQLVFN